jgi:hypothetical protein
MFKRKNNRIDNILDDCLEKLLVKGRSIEECLADYPEQADELKPLLQTAIVTRKAIVIEPRPEFRAKARYQLYSALKEAASKRHRFPFVWHFRWATVISTFLILMLTGGGIVAAASNSMPDNPLYQVKLATEQIQLSLTTSPLDKAKLYAKLADRRVTEIINMAQEGNVSLVEITTQRLDNHLTMIAHSSTIKRDDVSLTGDALETTVPTPEVTMTEAGVTATIPEKTAEILGTTPTLPTATEPPDVVPEGLRDYTQQPDSTDGNLAKQIRQQSSSNIAALYEALESAAEEVKPALMQAITVLEVGYENALNAIGE